MPDNQKNDKPIITAVMIAAILLIVLRMAAAFSPEARLWGLNHAAFIDGMWLIYPVLIILISGLYYKRRAIENLPEQVSEHRQSSLHVYIIPAIIGLVAVAAFHFFSVEGFFLGDGLQIISRLPDQNLGIPSHVYGETIVHKWMLQILGTSDYLHAYLSYRYLSIAAGIIFVATTLYYCKKITASRFTYYTTIVLLLTNAITILYYGYVENYSILSAAIYLFLISGLSSVINKKRSVVPLLAFCASVFLHNIAIVYLPALIIYILLVIIGGRPAEYATRKIRNILYIFAFLFLAAYVWVKAMGPQFWKVAFLSPFPDRYTLEGYFLFSVSHLVDYLNLLVLLIPVSIVVMIAYILFQSRAKSESRRANHSAEWLFLGTASLFGLIAAFILEPKIGMARDWDLMSMLLIGPILTGIYVWAKIGIKIKYSRVVAMMLIVMNISIFIPWLSLNNSEKPLYDYSVAMMELDPKHSRPGFYVMRNFNIGRNHPVEAARLKFYCNETFPEMTLVIDGWALLDNGDVDQAEVKFDSAIIENPTFTTPYMGKAQCRMAKEQWNEALDFLIIAEGFNPGNTEVNCNLGTVYFQLGDTSRALDYWQRSLYFDASNPEPLVSLGKYYLDLKLPDSALFYFNRLPDSLYPIETRYLRGLAYIQLGDSTAALNEFNRYMGMGNDSVIIRDITNWQTTLRNK